ncbi:MAG: response regulator [Chloroflexi bacterium]|nr:response regulator [Chloroflexota bacterium]
METIRSDPKRILVIEDEPAIAEVCARTLTAEGFEVDIAANGRVAQQVASSKPYLLLLADIRTPAMDGKEFYNWLAENHPPLAKRVLFTSGDIIGKDTIEFLEQTGRPFLPKPFTPEELRNKVKEALERLEG